MGANRNPKIVGGGVVRETTWANRGNAADYANDTVFFTDIGAKGIYGYSNGSEWVLSKRTKKHMPSSYVAIKSATTTVAGQSEKIATGAKFIYAKNLDATNTVKIGFGTSYATAEAAASAATEIAKPYLEFNFPVPAGKTHYSWLGVGGTVSVILGQAD